jgi:hypothetical protein
MMRKAAEESSILLSAMGCIACLYSFCLPPPREIAAKQAKKAIILIPTVSEGMLLGTTADLFVPEEWRLCSALASYPDRSIILKNQNPPSSVPAGEQWMHVRENFAIADILLLILGADACG